MTIASQSVHMSQLHLDVLSAQSGDQKAFARLVNSTRNTVTSIALAIVKDIDGSEDVAQQVYIDIWHGLNKLKNHLSFMPWVRQITRYKAYNFLRDNKVKQKVSCDSEHELIVDFLKTDDTPASEHLREQQSVIVKSLIEQLPDDSREMILLYYREDCSTQQVAELLDVSDALVRKKISRARQTIKKQWLERYGEVLLSTAPTFGFTALIISAATGSSPATASVLATSMASGKSTLLSKLLALMGGAMIGAALGALAVEWSSRLALKKLSEQQAKQTLKTYRTQTIAWIMVFGLLLAVAYEFTTGWIAPTITYILFTIGLYLLLRRTIKHLDYYIFANKSLTEKQQRQRRIDKFCGFWGTIGGCLVGFIGLIIGLIGSGRLS